MSLWLCPYNSDKLYSDDDGYGTQHVGYGHACEEKDCAEVQYPIPISKTDAEKLLQTDLKVRFSKNG